MFSQKTGLDVTWQWYFYDSIRMHCKSTLAADLTCPRPSQPKPTKKTSKTVSQTPSTPTMASWSTTGSSTIAGNGNIQLYVDYVMLLDTPKELVLIGRVCRNVRPDR